MELAPGGHGRHPLLAKMVQWWSHCRKCGKSRRCTCLVNLQSEIIYVFKCWSIILLHFVLTFVLVGLECVQWPSVCVWRPLKCSKARNLINAGSQFVSVICHTNLSLYMCHSSHHRQHLRDSMTELLKLQLLWWLVLWLKLLHSQCQMLTTSLFNPGLGTKLNQNSFPNLIYLSSLSISHFLNGYL